VPDQGDGPIRRAETPGGPTLPGETPSAGYPAKVPTFDVVSQVDKQEVRNAVDQARRELATRFDFKNTESSIDGDDVELELRSSTEDRLRAVVQVLEEKLVRRKISLKAVEYGKVEQAAKGTVRQSVTLTAGISPEKAKAINRFIKEKGPKGLSSQTQDEQIRVTGKKRDDLQAIISALREGDFGIPLQFENFRD